MPVRDLFETSLLATLLFVSGLLVSVSGPVSAQSDTAKQNGERGSEMDSLVEFSVYPDTDKVQPGEDFTLLFHARMKPEWHIYWENSGETGMATKISVDAPEGFQVGSIQWPRPIRFQTGKLTTYGYRGETVLFVPVTAPDVLPDKPYTFTADITSLACKEKCIMQREEESLTLPSDSPPAGDLKQTVKRHRAAIPEPFSSLEGGNVSWKDGDVVFSVPRNGTDDLTFFPVAVPGVELGSPSVSLEQSTYSVRVPVEWNPKNHLGEQEPAVKGVIALGKDPFGPSYRISVPLGNRKN